MPCMSLVLLMSSYQYSIAFWFKKTYLIRRCIDVSYLSTGSTNYNYFGVSVQYHAPNIIVMCNGSMRKINKYR